MPEWCPPPGNPDPECLWCVAGIDPATGKECKTIGVVRAPDRDTALLIAVHRYPGWRDLYIRGEPLPDRHSLSSVPPPKR